MEYIMIASLVGVYLLFVIGMNNENRKISIAWGKQVIYSTILNLFKGDGALVLNVYRNSIELGLKLGVVQNNIILTHLFGKINIEDIQQSPLLRKRKKEWTFPENFNQTEMFNIICEDLDSEIRKYFR